MKSLPLLVKFIFLLFPSMIYGQLPILGSASNFVLFTTTGAVSNTGISSVTDKIGTNNGAITGFDLSPGQSENANDVTAQASTDLLVAFNILYLSPQTYPTHAGVLGNDETLYPGVYSILEASSIEGNLILDALGNNNAVFIIKIEGALSPGPASQIILAGGASACNVYWIVKGGAIAIAAEGKMKGNFIASPGAVSMAATSELEGRLLSTTGAIAVDGIIATLPMCSVLLPLRLLNFNVRKETAGTELYWTSADENSFAGYEIQGSARGRIFDSLGFVNSTGNTGTIHYQWTDKTSGSQSNFYRLKMMDLSGFFSYSSVRFINRSTLSSLSVFPNPVTSKTMQVRIAGLANGNYQINMYNAVGLMVRHSIGVVGNDSSIDISLNEHLQAGTYFLIVTGADGRNQKATVIVK